MQSVALSMLSVLVALFPVGLIVALLRLSNWRQRNRLAEISRQIAVTDAIHAALGAVVSPVVRRRLWRRWQLTIPVPLDRPDTVMQVVGAAYGAFGAPERTRPGRFEIVLTPQERPVPRRDHMLVAASTARGESVSWI
jgi:hypothetical protein